MKEKIAVFDFDGTIINGDSLLIAAFNANHKLGLIINIINFIPNIVLWKLGLVSTSSTKQSFLKKFNICDLFNKSIYEKNLNNYINSIKNDIREEALERIRFHKDEGDRVIVCSASFDMLLQPITQNMKVELISTRLSFIHEKWHPRLISKNCNGIEKVERLKEVIGDINNYFIESYGDSSGDKELLRISDIEHFRTFSKRSLFDHKRLMINFKTFINNKKLF